jgi:integrase
MKKKTRRSHGEGGIDARGPETFRLRYRIGGRRFTKTMRGTLGDAKKELRALLRSGDTGQHVEPDKMTLRQWVAKWIAAGAPGKRKKKASTRSVERYEELLETHVLPTLGDHRLQGGISATDIDALYVGLEQKIAPRTATHVHSVFNACLATAVRTGKLVRNPMEKVSKIPSPGESDHGIALEEDELRRLVQGFRDHALFAIVSVAAFTGARRNEILALRWSDLDVEKKTLRIERAIEETDAHGLRLKGPKKDSHKRTIALDDELIKVLLADREKHLRLTAGVPDGAPVDLSLVKLPADALMFPNPPGPGESFSLTALRVPDNMTKSFQRRASKLGIEMRFHDLRGTHETLLLDAGVPPHVVAKRCGHDPATLLRIYAKRTKKADTSAAAVIGALSKGALS